jgi:uncharacterized protein (DUF305 family)
MNEEKNTRSQQRSVRLVWLVASWASVVVLANTTPLAADSPETAFLAENDAAMKQMHKDMHVQPSGDVDRDFVAMMVPHHQGAIDMAKAVLRYGNNEQIRRVAQEIIIEQQQEIAAMQLAVQPMAARKVAR